MDFVHLFRPPVGRPMSSLNIKGVLDRLARAADHPFCASTCCATPP
ncbi:hypothetical protein OG331_47690 [Streptomyces sp. NBC_01017]|nr:hypothetical protein OG331_04290 [Streptomyces sp. NBC_01017]WSV34750.1 hypothetical protein OG331_47690 [Streptomyces sp. NBC_01017]